MLFFTARAPTTTATVVVTKFFAEKVGTSQANVSKIEAGLCAATDDFIKTVAHKLDFAESFFFRDVPLYDAANSILYHRKRESLPKKKLAAIHAWLNIHRLAATALDRSVDIVPRDVFLT